MDSGSTPRKRLTRNRPLCQAPSDDRCRLTLFIDHPLSDTKSSRRHRSATLATSPLRLSFNRRLTQLASAENACPNDRRRYERVYAQRHIAVFCSEYGRGSRCPSSDTRFRNTRRCRNNLTLRVRGGARSDDG